MATAKPSSTNQAVISITTSLLLILWVYAAISKLSDYETSRSQMLNQVFPQFVANILVWAVPVMELITAALLLSTRTIIAGLNFSLFLLLNFTVYIALVMTNVFGHIPCSCGGILAKMTWGQHLAFNLFYILLTLIALLFTTKKGGLWERDNE